MLTRRSVRVKTMQAIYSFCQNENAQKHLVEKQLEKRFHEIYEMFYFSLYILIQIADRAPLEKQRRRDKHLPSSDDLLFDDRIQDIEIIQFLKTDKILQKIFSNFKFQYDDSLQTEWVSKIFKLWCETSHYKKFMLLSETTREDEVELIDKLFRKLIFKKENLSEFLEEKFTNWDEEMKVLIFNLRNFLAEFKEEKDIKFHKAENQEDEIKFGILLFNKTIDEADYLKGLIIPGLVKWDWKRIALIDSILLKMAISELIYFPNIPVKVTINEYIEMAKVYSTPKSKDFINGVLDKVMTKLNQEKLINKTGRGLQE